MNNQNNLNFSNNESNNVNMGNDVSSSVNMQEVIHKNNKMIIIIVGVLVFLVALVVVGLFILSKPKNVEKAKEVVKSIYIYKWTDNEFTDRSGIDITDKSDNLNDDSTKKELLNKYECTSECAYYGSGDEANKFAIYDSNKLYEYDVLSNKFNEVSKTNNYVIQGYNFTSFSDWIVGSDASSLTVGYKFVSFGNGYEVAASLSTLKSNTIALYKNGKMSIYNGDELFYEKEIDESFITDIERKDGFYLVAMYGDALVVTDEKVEIDVSLEKYDHSIYDNKLLSTSSRTSIDVFDKSGILISSTPYSSVAGVYDNYSIIINNDEVQLIDAITKDVIYNFGPKLTTEILMNNYSYDLYVSYNNDDENHTISVFLEDEEKRLYEPLSNRDNMFGRKFIYNFKTHEGKIEEASIYNPQNN